MVIYSFNLLFTMSFWVFMLIYCLNIIPNIKMSVMTCRHNNIDDYIQGYGHFVFLRCGVFLIVFHGFYIKPRASFLSVLMLVNTRERDRA